MGEELAAAIGAKLLPEPALLETDYGTVLLTHGDEFSVPTTPRTSSSAPWCAIRNGRPPSRPRPFRNAWPWPSRRGESQAANQMKSQEIMDVNPGAIEAVFRDTGVSLLVHGHTHRPARHVLEVDGKKRERWVLPDWDCDHAQTARRLAGDRSGWPDVLRPRYRGLNAQRYPPAPRSGAGARSHH